VNISLTSQILNVTVIPTPNNTPKYTVPAVLIEHTVNESSKILECANIIFRWAEFSIQDKQPTKILKITFHNVELVHSLTKFLNDQSLLYESAGYKEEVIAMTHSLFDLSSIISSFITKTPRGNFYGLLMK
jgi:hypothetical protein